MAIVPADLVNAFRQRFDNPLGPALYRAPGRVNLIGEHTDYNLGFVLPIALNMACYAAIAPANSGNLRVYSQDLDREFQIPVADIGSAQAGGNWHDYVIGVANQLLHAGFEIAPADLLIRSEVPAGSGLSSSAALEIATALALLGARPMARLDLALLGQRAESSFVGMPCGIMDQYASVFGRAHAAIKIDCRSQTHDYVSLPENVAVIAVNSMVKHELGSSAYRERVRECQEAVAALQQHDSSIRSLRDVSLEAFTRLQESIPPIPRQRARHIVTDTQRVVDFSLAAKRGDLAEMGRLFVQSHRSMQFDYEISCEEIDFLVDTAIRLPGVYGARMTGGGFGGCTVNLVEPEAVADFERSMSSLYQERYQLPAAFYRCDPADGASALN